MPPRRTIKLPPKRPEPSARKLLIAVCVLIAAVLIGYAFKDRLNFLVLQSSVTGTPQLVTISNFAFSSQSIIVPVGTTVNWKNVDSAPHTVTSDGAQKSPLNSPVLKTNEIFSYTFSTAGTHFYHCDYHPAMKASVIVEAASPTSPNPIQSSFTVTSNPLIQSPDQTSSVGWLAFFDKPGFLAQDNISLLAKISEIEKISCPERRISASSCPGDQQMAIKSGTDSCGNYSYTVCEAKPVAFVPPPTIAPPARLPSTPPPAVLPPTPPTSIHGAAEKYCFDDSISSMSDSDWELICEAKQRGIIGGSKVGTEVYFNPNHAINRAEAAKIITLGILKSLGKLNERHFSSMEEVLKKAAKPLESILFSDITYNESGQHPWYAPYIALAQRENIISGYPDKTFKPSYSLNHVEGYKIILETARAASKKLELLLQEAEQKSSRSKDWFAKYTKTLELLQIRFSGEYAEPITRKEFMRMSMELLQAIEL